MSMHPSMRLEYEPKSGAILGELFLSTSLIRWEKKDVVVDLTKDAVRNSPEYDPGTPITREYESRLFDFHGRPTYWS